MKRIIPAIFIIALLGSCSRDWENTISTVASLTTGEVTSITSTTSVLGGNITSDGGNIVTARGLCWSTSQNPSTIDKKTKDDEGSGSFKSKLTGLQPGTTYYARAYATNSAGTAYGNQVSFKTMAGSSGITYNSNLTYGTITDIEGNVYSTIELDTQIWMAENLKTSKFKDGTSIPLVENSQIWIGLKTPAYCWYKNDIIYKNVYGALYNWYAVNTGKLCPSGWHVPTYNEWSELISYLGGEDVAGGKVKESGTIHWASPNTGANNEAGFTALPGGYRMDALNPAGASINMNYFGCWWSSTEDFSIYAYTFDASNVHSKIQRGGMFNKEFGISVRCLKD